ncbi:MAG: hypothetical protein LC624_07390 [Halobacteriales archaeon]|nr:hypothetical protein [Halobacteriales archaeon]
MPAVDLQLAPQACRAIADAVQAGLCLAVHDVSEGGLAVTLAEMCLGGAVGATINVPKGSRADHWLFSEAPTRWLVEAKSPGKLGAHLKKRGVPFARIGTTGGNAIVAKQAASAKRGPTRTVLKLSVQEARKHFDRALQGVLG